MLIENQQQENLLTLLSQDDEGGRVVAGLVSPELFEGDYRLVAERLIEYWRKYDRAPKVHTADLFPELSDQHKQSALIRQVLTNMVYLSETIDRNFVLERLNEFVRTQQMKQVTQETADILQAGGSDSIERVESLWSKMLHNREQTIDPGIRMTEYQK